MRNIFIVPVLLILCLLQTNNLLFADGITKAKAGVSAAIAEASAEANKTAVDETVEAVVEEAAAEVTAEAVVEKAVEVATEVVTTAVAGAGAKVPTTAVAEAIEIAEAVVEEAASEVTAEAVVEKAVEVATEEVAPAVVAETKPEESAVAAEEKETDVIAVINGEKILRLTFDKRLNVFRRMNQEVTDVIKMQVVDQLTKKILLKQFVETQEISASAEDIKAEIEKIKFFLQNNPANKDKPLDEILETQGSSVTELEEEVSRALALSKYLESSVTDADKQSYFDANKDAFNGAKVKASHVLIDTRNLKTDAELEEAKKMIDIVKIEIDKGADFAEMARKYSNCPSAENGGDIGFFQRKGSIVEEFAVVAFAMKAGEISEPVKTQFGYHIIKVTEKEDGKDVNYADVSDMVDFVYMQLKTESLLKELHDKAEINITL
jgi:parvulin-like peptidyl-prolyl isomerase